MSGIANHLATLAAHAALSADPDHQALGANPNPERNLSELKQVATQTLNLFSQWSEQKLLPLLGLNTKVSNYIFDVKNANFDAVIYPKTHGLQIKDFVAQDSYFSFLNSAPGLSVLLFTDLIEEPWIRVQLNSNSNSQDSQTLAKFAGLGLNAPNIPFILDNPDGFPREIALIEGGLYFVQSTMIELNKEEKRSQAFEPVRYDPNAAYNRLNTLNLTPYLPNFLIDPNSNPEDPKFRSDLNLNQLFQDLIDLAPKPSENNSSTFGFYSLDGHRLKSGLDFLEQAKAFASIEINDFQNPWIDLGGLSRAGLEVQVNPKQQITATLIPDFEIENLKLGGLILKGNIRATSQDTLASGIQLQVQPENPKIKIACNLSFDFKVKNVPYFQELDIQGQVSLSSSVIKNEQGLSIEVGRQSLKLSGLNVSSPKESLLENFSLEVSDQNVSKDQAQITWNSSFKIGPQKNALQSFGSFKLPAKIDGIEHPTSIYAQDKIIGDRLFDDLDFHLNASEIRYQEIKAGGASLQFQSKGIQSREHYFHVGLDQLSFNSSIHFKDIYTVFGVYEEKPWQKPRTFKTETLELGATWGSNKFLLHMVEPAVLEEFYHGIMISPEEFRIGPHQFEIRIPGILDSNLKINNLIWDKLNALLKVEVRKVKILPKGTALLGRSMGLGIFTQLGQLNLVAKDFEIPLTHDSLKDFVQVISGALSDSEAMLHHGGKNP